MRRTRTLHTLLTLNAILMAALIWTTVAERPLVASAEATGPKGGIPDAGSQRLEMIRELRRLNDSVGELGQRLDKGQFKVEVTKMPRQEPTGDEGGQ
ncbi:MAG: hypothetical protein ACF8PN_15875 [Phycisphaerales bacterium]